MSSLRTKLLVLSLLLVVVPGAVFGVVVVRDARRALHAAVGRQLATVANDAARDLRGLLAEESERVRVWARQDVMREIIIGDLDKRVARFLGSVLESNPGYVALACTDAEGRIVAASEPALVGTATGGRGWFAAARRGEDVLAGPLPAADGTRRVLEVATPIHDPEEPGAIIGVFQGHYDWAEVTRLMASMRDAVVGTGMTVDVLLLDERGVVIGGAGGALTARVAGRDLRADGWEVAQPDRVGGRQAFTLEPAAAAVVGSAPVGGARPAWTVLVAQAEDDALAPVAAMRRRLLLALAGVLLAGLAVAAVMAERMIRPLRRLTAATRALARTGTPGRPIPVRTGDEIGELARSFNAMAAELERARDDLTAAARLAFVGEVAAGIAHEVRTPLGILRGSAQMLARALDPATTGRPAELVQMIIEEVDRLDGVVASLMELARPREPAREPTPLGPLLARALDFVAAQAEAKGVIVHRRLAADAGTAYCDPEQIYQVALNVIVNALQMVPRGGEVTVRTAPAAPGRVAFEVSDNGPGIPPELRPHIFTPFVTSREGGTGLGLALVERVVRAHGGSVGVESALGRGATFHLELPAAEGRA